MSNAASTVPAKRNLFRTKQFKIPSLDDKPKKETKSRKNFKSFKRGNADVLTIKHKENDVLQMDSEQGHFEDEETLIGKANDVLQSGLNKLADRNAKHRKRNPAKMENNLPGASSKPTIRILNVDQYENLMTERKQLLELNEKCEKRIAEQEQEIARVLGEFANLYEDNEKLRRKMDTGKDPLLETYSRVFEDRKILREAEGGYKKRIIRLEKEIMEKQKDCEKLQDEVKALKSKIKPTCTAEDKHRKTNEMKLQAELRKVKTENETLRNNLKALEKTSNEPEMWRIKSENDSLKSVNKKLQFELSRYTISANKTQTPKKDKPKPKNDSKLYQITFEEKPIIFDYEYLLPDSQIYD